MSLRSAFVGTGLPLTTVEHPTNAWSQDLPFNSWPLGTPTWAEPARPSFRDQPCRETQESEALMWGCLKPSRLPQPTQHAQV